MNRQVKYIYGTCEHTELEINEQTDKYNQKEMNTSKHFICFTMDKQVNFENQLQGWYVTSLYNHCIPY